MDVKSETGRLKDVFVSLDLETTGLDSTQDQIMEIGAVKFRGDDVVDTFHSMVNPYRPIPHRIRWLTGITSSELEGAPPFAAVASDLSNFLGDCPIVGQNVGFDLAFLQAQGIDVSAPIYDTLGIARILLPSLSDHTLSTLARELGVEAPISHRALDDAITTKGVFVALLDRASQLHPEVIGDILRLTTNSDWIWRRLLANLDNAKQPLISAEARSRPGLFAPTIDSAPLVANDKVQTLDIDQLTQLLGEDGALAKAFPAFEYRPCQVTMMQAVAQALNLGQTLITEAGTGTGKSVAYLLPALFFALQNHTRVVISTSTINLQEQLVQKDIPDLLQALAISESPRVAQLKGRSNYLCWKQWNSRRQTAGLAWDETSFLLRLVVWLSSTSTGDRAELNINRDEAAFWNRLCASEENCTPKKCAHRAKQCYLYNARRQAEGSHIVVVNHALLLSDLVATSRVLPEYQHLVIDEAHHLEEEATEQLGYEVTQWDLYRYLDHLGDRNGVLGQILSWLQRSYQSADQRHDASELTSGLLEQAKVARRHVSGFFEPLSLFLQSYVDAGAPYEQNLRLVWEVRRQNDWHEIEKAWNELDMQLQSIEAGLTRLCPLLESLCDEDSGTRASLWEDLLVLRQRGQKLRDQVDAIIVTPDDDRVDWVSLRDQQEVVLHAAPLHVGQVLDRLLFSQKESVVLTSATLSTEGNFEYAKERLGLIGPNELMVESPFDYRASALVYLPDGVPSPNNSSYQSILEQSVTELCKATKGRALILFTSHASLRATYSVIQPTLEAEDILLLGQGIDGSPKNLLKTFKATPRTVLMGTASLWEGIDVVGNALSTVVITKLPFSVPSDPIFSARSELFDNPFNEYALPQAILKFKQGFGRLIRSRHDRGAVILLDSRLRNKSYGKAFLGSLPPCTVRTGPLHSMPQEVVRWLSTDGSRGNNE